MDASEQSETRTFNGCVEEVNRLRAEAYGYRPRGAPETFLERTKALSNDVFTSLRQIDAGIESVGQNLGALQGRLGAKRGTLTIGRDSIEQLVEIKETVMKILAATPDDEEAETRSHRGCRNGRYQNYVQLAKSVTESEDFNDHCRSFTTNAPCFVGQGAPPVEEEISVNTIDSAEVFASSPLLSSTK